MTRLLTPAVVAAALALTGCGEKTTDVTGKVTYKGKPVAYGTVAVLDGGPAPKTGQLLPDGTYRIVGVKLGAFKAAVSSPPPPGSDAARRAVDRRDADDERVRTDIPAAPPEVLKAWVALPDRFGDPAKSGLTADVKAGQPVDFDLN
jgi:hypothetical protein